MVTSYPRSIAAHPGITRETVEQDDGRAAGVWDRVRQAMCGLHGHDRLMHFERDRVFLRCASCGHETPGWELRGARPVARTRTEGMTRPLPQLVGDRKIA